MKLILRLFTYTLSTLVLLCLIVVIFGVSNEPEEAIGWTLTPDDIGRAKKILHEGAKTKPDEVGTIELTKDDLNLATNYLLNRYIQSAVKIELKNNAVRFSVTMTLPHKNILGQYVNISFKLGNEKPTDRPKLTKFKAGALILPARLAAFIIDTIIHNTQLKNYYLLAINPLKSVDINEQRVIISYYSSKETRMRAGNILTQNTNNSPELNIYQQKINEIVNQHDPAWRLSLADLLKSTFQLAFERSTVDTAISENKLAIMAVNNYVNHKEPKGFLTPPTANNITEKYYPAFLYKRADLAQHFIGSAAITASTGREVAKVMGEEKELSDANGGSGFSFIDLTADKAGTKFGEITTSSPENARKAQKAIAEIKDYSDFMPDPRDLPEHMNEAEFKDKYGSIESPVYKELSKEIDNRISKMLLYQ